MDDEEKTDDEFDERFLQVFGLGDPESQSATKIPVARTPSQPDPNEREELLKRQAKNSPWLVMTLCMKVQNLSSSKSAMHTNVQNECTSGVQNPYCLSTTDRYHK